MEAPGLKIQAPHKAGWKEIFHNWKTWWLILTLVVILVASVAAYQVWLKPKAETGITSQLQTAVARRGELVVFATGAGQVIPTTQVNVGFDESGTLAELLVKVGDQVETGQLLARLQTDKSADEIALALAEAELNVLTAQQALDDMIANSALDAAQALLDVEEAEQALEDLQNNDLRLAQASQAVAEAVASVKSAERIYTSVRLPADQNTIATAYAELVLAEKKLKEQQDKFKDYINKPDNDPGKASQQLKLSAAQQAYDQALRYYNAVTGTGSELDLESTAADLAAAKAQLAEAQREWERIQDGPTPGELALAETKLAIAQATYERLKNGPDPVRVALAEAELTNAKARLAVAQGDQAVIDLLAPMEGTILSIDASLGETVGTGGIITLADLDHPLLDVYLDETDVDKAGVGFEAEVVFDSLPDITFTGKVVEVNPSLQRVSNIDAVLVKVQLDADSFSKPQSLPVGSNASVDVIGGRVENAVLVPVEALRELGPGEYAVFVMEAGEPRLRPVTVALMDFTSAAITSGLQAGDIVTTGVVETSQ